MKNLFLMVMMLSVLTLLQGGAFAQQLGDKRGGGRPKGYARPPDRGPKVGDMAPTFQLMSLDGKKETDLDAFRGKKPVVLFFGSYT